MIIARSRFHHAWFPMRIAYGRDERVLRLKQLLDDEGIENFLPMRYKYTKTDNWEIDRQLVPAIHGLIFVYATQNRLTDLKMTRLEFEPMHYMTNSLAENLDDAILTVPSIQMDNFMRVASIHDDRFIYLHNLDFVAKPGKRVRITEGDFKGVEGIIKRIKKNQCVVVQVEGVAAIALTFVPNAWLEEIT